jgi:hypothetical protein
MSYQSEKWIRLRDWKCDETITNIYRISAGFIFLSTAPSFFPRLPDKRSQLPAQWSNRLDSSDTPMAPTHKTTLFTVFADPTPSSSALALPHSTVSGTASKTSLENKENVGPNPQFLTSKTPERKSKSCLSSKQHKKKAIQDDAARTRALWNGRRPFSEASPDVKQHQQLSPRRPPRLRTATATKKVRRAEDDVGVVGAPSAQTSLEKRKDFRPNPNAAFFKGQLLFLFLCLPLLAFWQILRRVADPWAVPVI